MNGRDWTRILAWTALAFVVLEIVSAFFIEVPVAALVFAALFLVGALLLRRAWIAGIVLLGLLFVVELLGLPFYAREDADDWIVQALVLVLAVVGVVVTVLAFRERRGPARAET